MSMRSDHTESGARSSGTLRAWLWTLMAAWTAVVAASYVWQSWQHRLRVRALARTEARAMLEKDLLYRRWATEHGGVYVPITEKTQPNPYLKGIREREIVTPSGRVLTRINPEYMTRQVYELAGHSEVSHLTGLDPVNPENAPDDWEAAALRAFRAGQTEVDSVVGQGEERHLRLMRPMVTEERCLACHQGQGNRVGEVQGGASVTVPMAPFEIVAGPTRVLLGVGHGAFWVLGLLPIGLAFRHARWKILERERSEAAVREREERIRLLLASAAEAIYGLDTEGRCTFCNPACLRVLGHASKEELLGKPMHDLMHHTRGDGTPYPSEECVSWESIRHGKEVHLPEALLWRADGTSFPAEWWSYPVVRDGEVLGAVVTFFDITDRKRAEEALRRAHDELEHKVEERTRELARANERLQELDRLKSMFIASMSHELRTPLNSIIGFTGVILQGMAGELNDRQRDQLQRVYRAAKHLLALITDVIDISKIEAGKIEAFPEPFPLDEMIAEAVDQVEPRLVEKGIGLEVSVPPDLTLRSDRRRLLQCVVNYLSNAAKYSESGTVRVVAREAGDEVEIAVSDSGVGIGEDELPRLFQPFVRLDSPLKVSTPGTGLGLYLTRKLATEVLGGAVSAESRPGQGSTFTLRVPKLIPQEEADPGGDGEGGAR